MNSNLFAKMINQVVIKLICFGGRKSQMVYSTFLQKPYLIFHRNHLFIRNNISQNLVICRFCGRLDTEKAIQDTARYMVASWVSLLLTVHPSHPSNMNPSECQYGPQVCSPRKCYFHQIISTSTNHNTTNGTR